MDTKSKVLLWVMVLLVGASVGFTYYKTVILKDFDIVDTSSEDADASTTEADDLSITDNESASSTLDEEIVATSSDSVATGTPDTDLP